MAHFQFHFKLAWFEVSDYRNFWKMFLLLNKLFDAKILIKRLPSFNIPKFQSCSKHGYPKKSYEKTLVSLMLVCLFFVFVLIFFFFFLLCFVLFCFCFLFTFIILLATENKINAFAKACLRIMLNIKQLKCV